MSDKLSQLEAPRPLTAADQIATFNSGEPALDDWLRQRALANMAAMATKTYVSVIGQTSVVVGYYALAMGQISQSDAIGAMRRNMPAQIPAVLLARLAIDKSWQGCGLGRLLLQDAIERAARAADAVSARLVITHAISPAAEAFYARHGFVRLPVDAPTYALDLVKYARAALDHAAF